MKKLYIGVLAILAVSAGYSCFTQHQHKEAHEYLGDADALGSDDDDNARYNYELMRLCDPETGKIPAHIRERELAFAATLPSDRYLTGMRTAATEGWKQRGPWNVGGRTRAFGIDVANQNILIAGSTSGGMWRSVDMGRSWTMTSTPDQLKSVSCLTQDTRPGHTNVWYYGTGEAYGTSASGGGSFYLGNGIYKSTDNGQTWKPLTSTLSTSAVSLDGWADMTWNIAADPSNMTQDVVYAAGYGTVYKTKDGGTSWTPVLGSFGSSYYTDVAVSKTGVVYATLSSDGGVKGIYRSADGVTFTDITPASFPANYKRMKIGISPMDENQVFFLGCTPNYGQPDTNYIGDVEWNSLWKFRYVSGDGSGTGAVWKDLSGNLPTTGGLFDKFTSQGAYDLVVRVKPNDTNIVFIGGTNVYRSTTGFSDDAHTTFIGGYKEHATLPVVDMYLNHHPDQHELVFLPGDPNKMISTNDGGIFYCNDNTAANVIWSSLNNGYITSMFYTCAIDHAGNNDIIIGGAQDNGSWFTSTADGHAPWVTPRGGDGSYCAIADATQAYYFSIQNGKMMRAVLDYSGNVDSFARIDPRGGHGYLFINPFTLDPNNNNIMYLAGGKSLWRNNDLSGIPYAGNWDSISTNWVRFPDSNFTSGAISTITACRKPANRVYFGTSTRKVFRIDSANAGTPAFKDITSTSGAAAFPTSGGNSQANVSCIAVDPNNGDHIMVVYSNYNVYSLFYSADGGATWSKCAGNLEVNKKTGAGDGPSCRWASIIPVEGGTVYLVGTSVGLFATTQLNDTSTVWVQQGANTIGSAVVDMIDYRSTDGLVVIATHSNGIYSTHISSVGDITRVEDVVAGKPDLKFTTYPNPFVQQTTLQFELDRPAHVNLHVYDQLGRVVKQVADEQAPVGTHRYVFSGDQLPAGVYYCSLKAGEFTETKRIVLTK